MANRSRSHDCTSCEPRRRPDSTVAKLKYREFGQSRSCEGHDKQHDHKPPRVWAPTPRADRVGPGPGSRGPIGIGPGLRAPVDLLGILGAAAVGLVGGAMREGGAPWCSALRCSAPRQAQRVPTRATHSRTCAASACLLHAYCPGMGVSVPGAMLPYSPSTAIRIWSGEAPAAVIDFAMSVMSTQIWQYEACSSKTTWAPSTRGLM